MGQARNDFDAGEMGMLPISLWKKLSRGPQVIALKDAAAIVAHTGLQSGDLVVDAGAGSGWLAIFLARIVAPGGKVVSYERRREFAELARKNVLKAGLENVVEVKEKDVFEGIAEEGVDLVTLDLADAEKALGHAKKALKRNGWVVGYFPTVEQAQRFVAEAEQLKLRHMKTIEVQEREWKVRAYGSRPEHFGMQFTALLCFLENVSGEEWDKAREEEKFTKKWKRDERIRRKLEKG